ncbi:MAG: methylmalonyl-CoA mutase, partial [Bacteroidia bacterium]|nr:methylmalonyl-CoA mutase [Bacteroidia bacterium]
AENRLDSLNDLMKELSDSDMDLLLEFERIPNAHHDSFFSTLGSKDFDLDIDILGNFARTGNWYYDKVTDHQLLKTHIDNKNNRSVLSVSTDLYQNAGANIIQQLAYGLAHMNEYLNHYQDGINLKPLFKVGVGSNYFFEIAKIRALRALWRSLSEVYSVADKCLIMAIPSRRNKTIYDYNNNMIRTTLECMSAKLGGADIIQNLPYDALYHKSNDFGERIARNQPLILKHESYFNAVLNAAEGSYYIESITTQ